MRKNKTLKQRWINARPGSVLILVIALLVLLALIGTAYLSSTQTERFTSHQNAINTEADLLLQGMANSVQSQLVSGVFGTSGNSSQYRPAYPDATFFSPITTTGLYYPYDTVGTPANSVNAKNDGTDPDPVDIWLADRLPFLGAGGVTWGNVSWPLFKDSSGEYTADSPLVGARNGEQPMHLGEGINKGSLFFVPTSYQLGDGTIVPAMQINGNPSGHLTGTNPDGSPQNLGATIMAASAAGTGVADSLLCKVPVGPINGITYYVATRIIDNNSAINASSAWSQIVDPLTVTTASTGATTYPPQTTFANGGSHVAAGLTGNLGFFRGNIGLYDLLDGFPATGSSSRDAELNALNTYRFGLGQYSPSLPAFSSGTAGIVGTPIVADPNNTGLSTATPAPANFAWYSQCDAMESQLTARPGNPGKISANSPVSTGNFTNQMQWLGVQTSAALAYKFGLRNPLVAPSPLEGFLYNELQAYARTTPYSANQVNNWYSDQFTNFSANSYSGLNNSASGVNASPLRTIVTGDSAVSNAISSRLGNSASGKPGTWTAGTAYYFGDWVTASDNRTYVCLIPNVAQNPVQTISNNPASVYASNQNNTTNYLLTPPVAGALEYWAYVPWTQQATKTSINTASFEQLYVAFAQMMTDSVGPDIGSLSTGTNAWQPPTQSGGTAVMPQFRNVIGRPKDTSVAVTGGLSSSQMLKLRAAIAAANVINMRSGTDSAGQPGGAGTYQHTILSRRVFLPDSTYVPTSGGVPTGYEAEVYGAKPGPFISEMVAELGDNAAGGGGPSPGPGLGGALPAAGPATPSSYIAIELVNPYPQSLTLKNWALCYVDRSTFGQPDGMGMSKPLPITDASGNATTVVIPPATIVNGVVTPGVAVIASAANPPSTKPLLTINGTATYYCSTSGQDLTQAIGKELFLMRPRAYDIINNTLGISSTMDDYNEGTNTSDMVPVDQLDLTGADQLVAGFKTTDLPIRLQYRRGSVPPVTTGTGATAVTTPSYAWNFIYPGPYDYAQVDITGKPATGKNLRSAGIIVESATGANGTSPLSAGNLGAVDGGATDKTAQNNTATTYETAPLELINQFMAGPNPLGYTAGSNAFPFGQFARNLDMLQIPFIGSYRIRNLQQRADNHFAEMNSVSMDSVLGMDTTLPTLLAEAVATKATSNTTPYAGFYEQIGRFCPVGDPAAQTGDFSPTPSNWHYHWGEKLLAYFTVQAPHDDYYPNVDPVGTSASYPLNSSGLLYPGATAPTGTTASTGAPVAIANNDTSTANAINAGTSEDTAGVEGLININTAPAPVLAQLPFYACLTQPDPTTGVSKSYLSDDQQRQLNAQLAAAIVADRALNGPFKSVFDLYRVQAFRSVELAQSTAVYPPVAQPTQGAAPCPANGVFVPAGLPPAVVPTTPYVTDSLRFDFKERFMLLNNISNLITTRSDTFTCYILLQGWRGVGTSNPTLAVQRRAAFILDRNAVTPASASAVLFRVPTD